MEGRIGFNVGGRRDLDFKITHAKHYKLILPHMARLTELLLLSTHQTNNCTSAQFTCMLINQNFDLPRGTSTAKRAIKRCSKCRLAISAMKSKIEPETGNVPEFKLPRSLNDENSQSYKYCFFDFKGPIMVNDDREFRTKKGRNSSSSSEKEKIKIYILNYTCALSRHTTLEVTQNRSYEATKMALLRIFFERGAPNVLVSDQESSFKAVAKDFSKIL